MPVPRFLRFPRLIRFRPFCPFWPISLFRMVISPYPSDRMCPFHVFARFLRFPRLARFRPFWSFLLFRMVISPYPATERARSTFSPFSSTYTFSPVLPVFAVSDGDFTISRRPNVPVPRFLRFPRLARIRPFCSFSPFCCSGW